VYFIFIIFRRFKECKYQHLLLPSVIITYNHIIKSTLTHIGAVMVSVLASIIVDYVFAPQTDQSKEIIIPVFVASTLSMQC